MSEVFFVQNGWIEVADFKIANHQVESEEWVKQMLGTNLLSEFERKTKMVESKMVESKKAEFKMAAIISENEWSQIELVWVRVRMEEECFWVNLREDNKVFESKMAMSESNMAEFKMAAIIKLSQNEWVWVRLN